VGDVAERINGIEGCYLAEDNPRELARKLGRVFKQRHRLDCRERLRDLSHENIAEKLKEVYQEVLAGRAAEPASSSRPSLRVEGAWCPHSISH
jgi:hypothetical protein